MLSWVGRMLAIAIAAAGLSLSGLVLSSAAAACGLKVCDDEDGPSTDGQTVTVQVSGSFINPGSDGSSGSGSTTVQVSPPCFYSPEWTGKEYFEGIRDGTIRGLGDGLGEASTYEPNPGYRQHKNDAEGYWWLGQCSGANYTGAEGTFGKYSNDWVTTHADVYVEVNQAPPVPDIPPELLLEAAKSAITLPDPVFEWNPQRETGQATIVNLDTWFWTDPTLPTDGAVTATAGPSSVTVDLGLSDVEYFSPPAGSIVCEDGGVVWSPGGASECVLVFPRATDGVEVAANSRWDGSWSFNGEPQGDLDPIDADWETTLTVDEIQSIVTDVD